MFNIYYIYKFKVDNDALGNKKVNIIKVNIFTKQSK